MYKAQIENIAEEIAKQGKVLSMDVMKRFMSTGELEQFMRSYYQSRKTLGTGDRAKNLELPISDGDLEMLRAYITETDTPVREIEARFGMKPGTFIGKVERIAIRLVYQNLSKLGM